MREEISINFTQFAVHPGQSWGKIMWYKQVLELIYLPENYSTCPSIDYLLNKPLFWIITTISEVQTWLLNAFCWYNYRASWPPTIRGRASRFSSTCQQGNQIIHSTCPTAVSTCAWLSGNRQCRALNFMVYHPNLFFSQGKPCSFQWNSKCKFMALNDASCNSQ